MLGGDLPTWEIIIVYRKFIDWHLPIQSQNFFTAQHLNRDGPFINCVCAGFGVISDGDEFERFNEEDDIIVLHTNDAARGQRYEN